MRPRLGITLGAAALAGLAGATVATSQPPAPRMITPVAALGAGLLGSDGGSTASPGVTDLPGWLMLRSVSGPTPPPLSAVVLPITAAAPPAAAASSSTPPARTAPLQAVLASFPVKVPAPLHSLPFPAPLVTLLTPVTTPPTHRKGGHHPGRKVSNPTVVSLSGHSSSR
jgi:hypothetical protein